MTEVTVAYIDFLYGVYLDGVLHSIQYDIEDVDFILKQLTYDEVSWIYPPWSWFALRGRKFPTNLKEVTR